MQWLADNGSAYSAGETVDFAAALNLVARFIPVRSPESNGVCESGLRMFSPREFIEQQSATPAEYPV